MRKISFALALAASLSCACYAAPLRQIPYPAGPLEGPASVAPETVDHEDSPYFAMPDIFEMENTASRVVLTHYPTYEQTTEYTCGPAAALTVLYFYGDTAHTEAELAGLMKTRPYPYGTNPKNMAAGLRALGYAVRTSAEEAPFESFDAFRDFLTGHLRAGEPLLVENVEWGGHWRVIIGYDGMGTETTLDDTLLFADPYDVSDHKMDGYTVGNAERFYEMWFDHGILPKEMQHQPWVVITMNNVQ